MSGNSFQTATDTTAQRTPDSLDSFGDYQILGELGHGGMGTVYKAQQRSLNRVVALKVIRPGDTQDDETLRRFRVEVEAAAMLEHPNIVPIYEVGEHDRRPYFTMKVFDGGTLEGRRLPPRELAQTMVKVARAVHFAHQRGVLHRDLKPGNILLDQLGEPHLTDFGLAKRTADPSATVSGAIVGTPTYMAPEQARALKDVTTAVDVWALGAILYEGLAGKPPFSGDGVLKVLRAVINDEPQKPSGDLGTIAMKCLSKEPAGRYESAAALADDLERWLRGEAIVARPVGAFGRAWRWYMRNRQVASLGLALVTASLIAVMASAVVLLFVGQNASNDFQYVSSIMGMPEKAPAPTTPPPPTPAPRPMVITAGKALVTLRVDPGKQPHLLLGSRVGVTVTSNGMTTLVCSGLLVRAIDVTQATEHVTLEVTRKEATSLTLAGQQGKLEVIEQLDLTAPKK